MNQAFTTPLLVVRLNARNTAWRLPRTADSLLEVINAPVALAQDQAGLPFSYTALPGRYLAELLHTAKQWHRGQTVSLLNPAFDIPSDILALLLAEQAEAQTEASYAPATATTLASSTQSALSATVHTAAEPIELILDLEERILAYNVPASVLDAFNAHPAVRDLSTLNAALDQTLINAMGFACRLRRVRTSCDFTATPALPFLQGMTSIAHHTANARLRCLLAGGLNETWAVLTHHAGDVLLALKVIEHCKRPLEGLITHAAYADIVRTVMPDLPLILVEGPLAARGISAPASHALNDELIYFERVVQHLLPAQAGLVFLRPVRGYVEADYTLAAQLAFTLGSRDDVAAFPSGNSVYLHPEPEGIAVTMGPGPEITTASSLEKLDELATNLPKVRGKRVLLHFDGGWPLKVYPTQDQRALIQLLQAQGCQIAVLGVAPDVVPDGVTFHRFTHLAALRDLILAHDLLIGMDSFPCHFASLHLGVPTLCLYASTRQINLAHAAPDYLAISQGLGCTFSCGSRMLCPRFGGAQCRNFIDPTTVANLFARCLVTP